jgi:hypothetical protein
MQAFQALFIGAIIILGYLGARNTITLFNIPRVGVTEFTRFIESTYRPGNLYLIPTDMESFRLAAKIPIFVDFKSHPYKSTEVIEWFKRVEIAKNFYASCGDTAYRSILQSMSNEYGITHVVLKSESSIANSVLLHESYRDSDFVIYEIQSH